MSRTQLLAVLLAFGMTAGCKAQSTPSQTAPPQQALDAATLTRHIEVLVRSEFNVPQDYAVTLGDRKPSAITGYDSLSITFSRKDKSKVENFLISKDNRTLARLETFDLATDPVFSIDVSGRPIRGNPNAKVTVINFDDLECPYCARLHQTLFPATIEHYKDTVRFIYRDNPLPPEMHPWAVHAAVDANCLAALNGNVYWTYVDYLHSHADEVTGPDRNLPRSFAALDRIARQEGTLAKLDSGKLDACINKQDDSAVQASSKQAEAMRIESAPAVFVDGERVDGAVPAEQLWLVIDRALRAAGVTPPAPTAPPAQPASAAKPGGSGK
ncbi:MAG: thioredoxin domain-containing protein [Terracidiphilus sp.]